MLPDHHESFCAELVRISLALWSGGVFSRLMCLLMNLGLGKLRCFHKASTTTQCRGVFIAVAIYCKSVFASRAVVRMLLKVYPASKSIRLPLVPDKNSFTLMV